MTKAEAFVAHLTAIRQALAAVGETFWIDLIDSAIFVAGRDIREAAVDFLSLMGGEGTFNDYVLPEGRLPPDAEQQFDADRTAAYMMAKSIRDERR